MIVLSLPPDFFKVAWVDDPFKRLGKGERKTNDRKCYSCSRCRSTIENGHMPFNTDTDSRSKAVHFAVHLQPAVPCTYLAVDS